MKRHRVVLLATIAALGAIAAGCGSKDSSPPTPSEVPPGAVAVVGAVPIPQADLDVSVADAQTASKLGGAPFPATESPDFKAQRNRLLNELVLFSEFKQTAKDDLDIEIKPEQIEEVVLQEVNGSYEGSRERFLAGLKEQGLTEHQYRTRIEQRLVADAVFRRVIDGVKVTDGDVENYYREHEKGYEQPAKRQVRHIMVNTKAEAEKLERQLRAGADFGKLARRYSLDTSTAQAGGKVGGGVVKGQSQPPFDKAVFSLETDAISAPVATQYGWHVIQPTGDIVPESTTPLAKVRPIIESELLRTKQQNAMKAWSNNARKLFASKVLYAKGYAAPAGGTG